MLFVGVIAIPAMVLGTAAFRGLAQERARVEQEFGARIRADAAQVAGRLDEAVERLVSGAEEPPLGGVVLEIRDGQVSWRPAEALSYNPGRESTAAGVPAALEKAQLAELRDRRFDEALAGYRKGRGRWPQWSLFLEARLLRKMGRKEEARLVWQSLARLPEVMLGALPSRFLARFETGDRSLLDDLEAGKWSF